MARLNVDIIGISELKWTGMGEFNSDDHYIYYCRQESLRRNGVAIMVNKRVRNAVLGCNLKNDRMISVRFQGKPFNITVIQVYATIINDEEAEDADIDEADIVLAATNDEILNQEIAEHCRKKHIIVNNCSDRSQCDFYFPGVIHTDDIVIGVTANGKNHIKVKKVTEQIKKVLNQ